MSSTTTSRWLRDDLGRLEKEGRVYSAGERLPMGVEAFAGRLRNA
jgi:hypothetical protein